MSIPTIPRALYDKGNLDVEAINENLRALSGAVRRNQALRYSTTSFVFTLDGMASTDTAAARTLKIFQPTAQSPFQIVNVEVVIYAAAGVTWSVSSATDTAWGGLSIATAGATVEATSAATQPIASTDPASFVFTASAASTITRGYAIVTILVDRGQQGTTSFLGYTPTLLSSTSSTAGSLLDTELAAVAAAVAQDTGAQRDLRIMCYSVRNLASGGSFSVQIPSGLRTAAGTAALSVNAVAPLGATITGGLSAPSPGVSFGVVGSGVTVLSTGTAAFSSADVNAPGTAGSDITITLSRGADGGAVAPLAYLLVWWI